MNRVLLAWLLTMSYAQAQCLFGESGQFAAEGHDISVSGNLALIGEPNSGSARLFVRQGESWLFSAALSPIDSSSVVEFGTSVALDGTRAVVSAASPEKVYVFDLVAGSWTQSATITPTSSTGATGFGGDVAVRGGRIAVTSTASGGVYVFDLIGSSWTQMAQGWLFGSAEYPANIALGDDLLVIGDPYNNGIYKSGRALFFELINGGWTLVKEDVTQGRLGVDLSIDDDRVAILSHPWSGGEGNYPSVRVYDRTAGQWVHTASIATTAIGWMRSVGLSGDQVLIAGWPVFSGPGKARVYSYRLIGGGWQLTGTVEPSSPSATDGFGSSLEIATDMALVGAPLAAGGGKTYVLQLGPTIDPYGTGCPGAGPAAPILSLDGCPTPGGAIEFAVEGGYGGSSAIVLFGLGATYLSMNVACHLQVWPVLPMTLTLPMKGAGPGNGTASVSLPVPATTPVMSFTCQAFSLEPAPSVFSNTNGVRVSVE